MKNYNAMTMPVYVCDFCMSPISNEEGTERYDIIRRRVLYGAIEVKKLHVCDKCMEEIVRVTERMLNGEL